MTDLSARSQRVADQLRAAGVTSNIVTLPDSAATAALAAAALGTEVGAIANSLVFVADDQPLLVMTSGAHRVDTTLLAERLGKQRIVRARPEQVVAATGQVIGGVAPVGHPTHIETVIDETLAQFDELWAAGGTAHTVFSLSFDELVAVTGGSVLAVS